MDSEFEDGVCREISVRGAFVVEVSAEDVAEIASIRLLVEPYAPVPSLRRAARAGEAHVDATNHIPASVDARRRFHRLFYDLSGHGLLKSLWRRVGTKGTPPNAPQEALMGIDTKPRSCGSTSTGR